MAVTVGSGTASKIEPLPPSENPFEEIVTEGFKIGTAPSARSGMYEAIKRPGYNARFAARNEQSGQPIKRLPGRGSDLLEDFTNNLGTKRSYGVHIPDGTPFRSTEFAFTDFGFDIPDDAIVRGIEVRVTRSAKGDPAVDDQGELILCGSFDPYKVHYAWEGVEPVSGDAALVTWRPKVTEYKIVDDDLSEWQFAINDDSSIIVAVAYDDGTGAGAAYKSLDGGTTWSSVSTVVDPYRPTWTGSEFTMYDYDDGLYYHSTDLSSWTAYASIEVTDSNVLEPDQYCTTKSFVEISGKLYAAGTIATSETVEAGLFISDDDGATWNASPVLEDSTSIDIRDIAHSDSSIVVGGAVSLHRTTDFTTSPTWSEIEVTYPESLYDYWDARVDLGSLSPPAGGWESDLNDKDVGGADGYRWGLTGSIAYGNGVYVAATRWRAGVVVSTDDGINWTYVDLYDLVGWPNDTDPIPNQAVANVQFRNGLFHVTFGTADQEIVVSANGTSWSMTKPFESSVKHLAMGVLI